jgi:hypothetical protein
VTVDRFEFKGIAADHFSFHLLSHVTASRDATVKRVRFSAMRLGDIPFFVDPLEEQTQLKAGESRDLPQIPVTLYFRDLDSLKTLEESIRSHEIRVGGRARAELELGVLERLALWQRKGLADLNFEGTLPVEVPGGELARTAAVLSVRVAEAALPAAGFALNGFRTPGSVTARDLKDRHMD